MGKDRQVTHNPPINETKTTRKIRQRVFLRISNEWEATRNQKPKEKAEKIQLPVSVAEVKQS